MHWPAVHEGDYSVKNIGELDFIFIPRDISDARRAYSVVQLQ